MDIVVQHAELIPGLARRGVWKISADLTRDGGTEQYGTIMPAETIEWRVAQFNITPREAMEMILVEPFITHEHAALDLLPTRRQARETKAEWVAEALDGGSITWQTGEPAWTISGGTESHVVVDSGDGDPLDTILDNTPVDDGVVEVMRERMDLTRAELQAQARAPVEPITLARPTSEEMRARLIPEPPPDAGKPSGPIEVEE